MSIKLTCPECDAALTVPESFLGKTLRCKHCGETFKAKAPASKTGGSKRSRDDDEEEPRPRRSRDDDDEPNEERPVRKAAGKSASGKSSRRKSKKKSPLPLILCLAGGLVVLAGVGVGIAYFAGAFGSGTKGKKESTDRGSSSDGTLDLRPFGEAPETPTEAADKVKMTQKLVGRWRWQYREPPPKGFFHGYVFNADGTFVPLDDDGNPVPGGGGTWIIVRCRGKTGFLSLKGKSAPALEKFDFELLNEQVVGFNIPAPPESGLTGIGLTYVRAPK